MWLLRKRRSTTKHDAFASADFKSLKELRTRGVEILAVFSEGSVAWDVAHLLFGRGASKLVEFENVQLEYLQRCDHVFTTLWSQDHLLRVVEEWACARMCASPRHRDQNAL